MSSGLEDSSLFDLFRLEADEQVRVLQTGLIQSIHQISRGTRFHFAGRNRRLHCVLG